MTDVVRVPRSRPVVEEPARVGRTRQRMGPEGRRPKEGQEEVHFLLKLKLYGTHPDWYDTYKVVNAIVRTAEAQINKQLGGAGGCVGYLTYFPESEVPDDVQMEDTQ